MNYSLLTLVLFCSFFCFGQKQVSRLGPLNKLDAEQKAIIENLGIALNEVILVEDTVITILLKSNGKTYTFNPGTYDTMQLDSLRQSIRWQNKGLNAYGVNTVATNLVDGIKERLQGIRIINRATGMIGFRVSLPTVESNNIPVFVVDGQIFQIPEHAVRDAYQIGVPLWSHYPSVPLDQIIDVEVLSSLAVTTRYGPFNQAGVIRITTVNAAKR